jgi:hypothetical protein
MLEEEGGSLEAVTSLLQSIFTEESHLIRVILQEFREESSRNGIPPVSSLVCWYIQDTIGGTCPQWSNMALSLGTDYQRYARLHTQLTVP